MSTGVLAPCMETENSNPDESASESGADDTGLSEPVKDRFNHGDESTSIFSNRKLLQPSNIVNEDRIIGRERQLDEVISTLEPALDGAPPDDMLIHGPPGTGKSLIVRTVANNFVELGEDLDLSFGNVYLNCRNIKSEDSAAYNLAKKVSNELGVDLDLAENGITTARKYERLFELISDHSDHVVIILDELDSLKGTYRAQYETPAYSDLLYELSRAIDNYNINYQITVAILTNDGDSLSEGLDSRVNSSFNPEQIVFDDYNATELRAILNRRKDAFRDGVLSGGVIDLAAAIAAKGTGDAREAIDLLKSAGKLAKKQGDNMVLEKHCKEAEDMCQTDFFVRELRGATISKQITIYAAAMCAIHNDTEIDGVPNKIAYNVQQKIADAVDSDPKSERQMNYYLDEYETNSLFAKTIEHFGQSKGSHSIYKFQTNPSSIQRALLDEDPKFKKVQENKEQIIESIENQYAKLVE